MRSFPRGPNFHPPVDEPDTEQLKALLIAAGYVPVVAEALAENGHNVDSASCLSGREALELVLHWQGILGFTDAILAAVRNIASMKPEFLDEVLP